MSEPESGEGTTINSARTDRATRLASILDRLKSCQIDLDEIDAPFVAARLAMVIDAIELPLSLCNLPFECGH